MAIVSKFYNKLNKIKPKNFKVLIMTPKEKAEKLIDKMMLGSKDRMYLGLAKQCALIAVNCAILQQLIKFIIFADVLLILFKYCKHLKTGNLFACFFLQ